MRRALISIPLIALLLLAGCGEKAATSTISSPKGAPIPRFDAETTSIDVRQGQGFEIALDSNPSTGYSWELVHADRSEVVSYLGSSYEPDDVAPGVVGSGGTQVLRFQATFSGEEKIKLRYIGPGRDAEIADTKTFPVNVSG